MNQRSATPNVLKFGDRQCRIIYLNSFWIQSAVINTTFSPLRMFSLLTENMHKVSRDDKTCWDNTQTACPLGCLTWCPLLLKRERTFLCFLQGRLAKFTCIIYSSKCILCLDNSVLSPFWAPTLCFCVRLWATLWHCGPPGSSVLGIFQARILEWVAMPSSRGSSWPRDQTCVFYIYLHWQAGSLPLAPPLLLEWRQVDILSCQTLKWISGLLKGFRLNFLNVQNKENENLLGEQHAMVWQILSLPSILL